jgi:hypothetical protein
MMGHGSKAWLVAAVGSVLWLGTATAQKKAAAPVSVPVAPDASAKVFDFRDGKYGVSFQVPAGWEFTRKDREVSTFHMDALSAPPGTTLRGVATLGFNPYPHSTLSGAFFYYSVERHSTDVACERQATGTSGMRPQRKDVQEIGSVPFAHGYEQHGDICVEARDQIYTAFRKGSCYRFDLALDNFCGVSSGASDLNAQQIHDIEQQMTGILSSVVLVWEKRGANAVAVPAVPEETKRHRGVVKPVAPVVEN